MSLESRPEYAWRVSPGAFLGEFLNQLDLTKGRCTGIPTIRTAMSENGSPPLFSTDEARTYFLAELPVHPDMAGFGQGQVEGQVGEGGIFLSETETKILFFLAENPKTRAEIAEMLGMSSSRSGYLSRALQQLRDAGLAELTIPDKPQSRNQRLRLTEKGEYTLPDPLRKKRADGSPYVRPEEVEAAIVALQLLPTKELLERAKVRDPRSSEYVPSECLLYFLRRARESSEIEAFRELFLALRQRILAAPPVIERKGDLLITFDNERAKAVLPQLASLSQRTQVFLFTHHEHLVEICDETLGDGGFTLHRLGTNTNGQPSDECA